MTDLRLATRGSDLALWQAHRTQELLGPNAQLVVIKPRGDVDKSTDLARFGSIGIFTVEVDRAVIAGDADVGVHSLKDMTTTLQDGVVLAGVLERGMIEDVLVAREPWTLDTLPEGARVGTGSQRRSAMLRAARPDLNIVPFRGNVPTRIAKVTSGEVDATVMARAGIVRLGLERHISDVLTVDRFLPAVGQAIVGLTCRADDTETIERLARDARDPSAWTSAQAERRFLALLKGGCNAPVGGHATVTAGAISLAGRVLSLDGKECVEGHIEGSIENAIALAEQLADDIAERGGARLVEEAREAGAV